ncbi:MAG: NAD-dependent succinate-semialdehyde dehydrogenase [Phycisphaeraceae bacterium]|nr:NAD-dependent succinate-semialdehyde dehydrogenase [Phycisphaeraceae bacterium]
MLAQPLYLNGQWETGSGTLAVENPATGERLAEVSTIDRARVHRAIQDAVAALSGWRATTAKQRGQYLDAIADRLENRAEAIARIITQENGKPLRESRGEVNMTVDHLRWFAEEGRRAYGRIVPHQADGKRHLVLRVPVGVVGAISPWNFPLVLAVRKVAPALAAGCPVLLKPASYTPLCALELARAADEAGLPPGVLQVVLGKSSEIAQEMLENPDCRKITFTGSTEVGKNLIHGAAATVTKLSLELGGHAPVLVFEDADLDAAVEGAIITKFRNTGQSCIAANRIYVQRSIYREFVNRFVGHVEKMIAGDGLDDASDIGPMINESSLKHAQHHIENACEHGASVCAGGQRVGERGYFLQPTVLRDVSNEALCMQEETFAPVAPIAVFDTEDEAIRQANNTIYGLAAYAFTRDVNRVMRLAEQLEAGTIGINDAVPTTSTSPFGGFKQSGWGRELGSEGLDAFLETKHVSLGRIDR